MGGSATFHPGCRQHSVEVLLIFAVRMLGEIDDRRQGDNRG